MLVKRFGDPAAFLDAAGPLLLADEARHNLLALADEWERLRSVTRRRRMAQRIYRLSELRPVTGVSGRPRAATEKDRSLLIDWVRAFRDEVLLEDAKAAPPEATVDARLGHGTGAFMLWEDGEPVSLAGWGGETRKACASGPCTGRLSTGAADTRAP